MNRMKIFLLVFSIFLVVFGTVLPVFAAPYESYNYSYDRSVKESPIPYAPYKIVDGEALNIDSLKEPEDIYITDRGDIYILDTGNNRIVCLDSKWNVIRIIDKFYNNGREDKFNKPYGIFVTKNDRIFIADTDNQRIVELTTEGEFIREIGTPESDVLRSNFKYMPIKVVVDSTRRIYVVSKGVFDGIMEFDSGGNFRGFIGVNPVKFSAADLFWKQIGTKEQRKRMDLFIPIEFNNVDIDNEGFIYTTTSDSNSNEPIKRLNPSGIDILKRQGNYPPRGDLRFSYVGSKIGPPTIIDVAVDKNGIYSILDAKRGRIFTYDKYGILMYQFGQIGELFGNFKAPVAIAMLGDQIIVVDRGLNHLTVFKPTRYGETIRNAVINSDLGEEEKSEEAWREAFKLNSNLEQAYIGIGKAHLRRNENYEAMENFKLGMHIPFYSKAYARYRKQILWDNFGIIATLSIIGIVLLVIAIKKIKLKLSPEPGIVRMGFYTMVHPFKGFWEIKYENKGRQWFTALIIILLTLTMALKWKYSGFIVNPTGGKNIDPFDEFKYIVLPLLLWCISNWSITSLMDGEGKFKEIVMVTGYALLPVLIVQIILIFYSHAITAQEASFYYLIETIGYLWFAWLLFAGTMTIHQYTVGKTIGTAVLTFIAMLIIIFIALLLLSLVQQMILFVSTIYREAVFRILEG